MSLKLFNNFRKLKVNSLNLIDKIIRIMINLINFLKNKINA